MSVHARFAVTLSLVSGTDRPVISASVKQLLTSRALKRVRSGNTALKCSWFVLCVSAVNQVLSASEIVRPMRLR